MADKIGLIRQSLEKRPLMELKELFSSQMPKLELIVTFLAMLELLKEGVLFLGKEGEEPKIYLFSQEGL